MTVLDEQELIEKCIQLHPGKPGRSDAMLKENGFPVFCLVMPIGPEELAAGPTPERVR